MRATKTERIAARRINSDIMIVGVWAVWTYRDDGTESWELMERIADFTTPDGYEPGTKRAEAYAEYLRNSGQFVNLPDGRLIEAEHLEWED